MVVLLRKRVSLLSSENAQLKAKVSRTTASHTFFLFAFAQTTAYSEINEGQNDARVRTLTQQRDDVCSAYVLICFHIRLAASSAGKRTSRQRE